MPRTHYRWAALRSRSRSPSPAYPPFRSQKMSQIRRRFSLLVTLTLIVIILLFAAALSHPAPREYAKSAAKTAIAKLPALTGTGFHPPSPELPNTGAIPNHVNFVYALEDPAADFVFQFWHFLSLYAALYHFKAEAIFLHTNAAPTVLERARSGESGLWAKRIFALKGFEVKKAELPWRTSGGKDLAKLQHGREFMAVKAVHEYGGVYLDFDVVALRDIAPLRKMGFAGVGGRQFGGQMSSGVFMARKYAKMTRLWKERMNLVYDAVTEAHSDGALTDVCQRLIGSEGGECMIMEKDAFAPFSGWGGDLTTLFGVNNNTKSTLEGLGIGGWEGKLDLPDFKEGLTDRWEGKGDIPGWARDWSGTYLLHAVNGDEKLITPRYVLDRRSNYARAAYPVVRDMYQKGLIEVDDTWDGK